MKSSSEGIVDVKAAGFEGLAISRRSPKKLIQTAGGEDHGGLHCTVLSARSRRLEERLGGRLFNRTSRPRSRSIGHMSPKRATKIYGRPRKPRISPVRQRDDRAVA